MGVICSFGYLLRFINGICYKSLEDWMIANQNTMEGRAIAHAVSRRPLTVETRVRSRVSPAQIRGA
jgi:hypothetical protein